MDLSGEQRLREDRPLLGRLLGDVVREQAGAAVFDSTDSLSATSFKHLHLRGSRVAVTGDAFALPAALCNPAV